MILSSMPGTALKPEHFVKLQCKARCMFLLWHVQWEEEAKSREAAKKELQESKRMVYELRKERDRILKRQIEKDKCVSCRVCRPARLLLKAQFLFFLVHFC